ncbi:phytanoyl-CoA dioxygenase family protein [Govanella unica]|uniref:Phytanoyl-CoA dioxygenase family protein n=1 Tax=Govanella unica TaxID=2975056 RepID=A0A9X3TWG5_9PROT|nr:phytanoyl-CoA dioxygenase family protein [Govania unica]MDA5193250.1 phytanoyl-CoA dioxygenase family protein [Govania unica]
MRQATLDLSRFGFVNMGALIRPEDCAPVIAMARADRGYDQGLFLSEAEFDANPQYKGVNPQPGRNLADRFDAEIKVIEETPALVAALTEVLGTDYQVLDRKFVCGVPETVIPDWLITRIKGNPVNNLGPYVRPEYRDITYFYGIDFHQDIIDWPARTSDFITLYIYLHEVTAADAPLYVLNQSHLLGATVFPHDLTLLDAGARSWSYGDRRGQAIGSSEFRLTGPAGYCALWHPCTLHGTQPDKGDRERISLRYLIARGSGAAGIDACNEGLLGPLSLQATRVDLDPAGAAQMRANVITGVFEKDAVRG